MNACSFFGHKEIDKTEQLKIELENYLITLITKRNYAIFYFGKFGDFDELCYDIISKLKNTYTHIKRILIAYNDKILRKYKLLYKHLYDDIITVNLSFDWWYTAIYYRNIAIIDMSNHVIFYVKNKTNSGAYKTMCYAISRKKDYVNFYN